ncbi:hypothetical protein SAMN02949497_3797 [Methylomagnum ishizawai]|uniref:Uncharacterized protein n=1 Tax=Methylomagnum ishizawai TaxID=1760988 RepID=A0A1Y6D1B2_9GAMM|nr:hypothetical protein [Methylomagnum ishizawai]SMF96401.1 hypothetical protein SAMN02949497_3797 [Methylomagnum ishizawai]
MKPWLVGWALVLALDWDAAEARSLRGKRLKSTPDTAATDSGDRKKTDSLAIEADESVAEQVNDPASFLREISLDTRIEHGTGPDPTTLELTPTLALPLGQRFRFESGIPVLLNGPGDRNDIEPGDLYGSLAYIFASTRSANYLADLRIDFPTGNLPFNAGQDVALWHVGLGAVGYAFQEFGFLLVSKLEYQRSIPRGRGDARIADLLGNLALVYLWSDTAYLRGEFTLTLNERAGWRNAGLFAVEAGWVFFDHYSVALGYEFDAWGSPELRNAANLALGYLF